MELLRKHFDTALESPDGIKKLRELILTLAMRGKLVKQDPGDQPAGELLKEIQAEKERLIKEGKIRKQNDLPPIKPEEVPYEVPEGWEWVRFSDIAKHNSGKTLDKSRNSGKYRKYITTSNLYWGRFELENVREMQIRENELEKCTATNGDLLICEGGEAGRAAVWDKDYDICFQNHIHRARFYKNIEAFFAFNFFRKLDGTGEINRYRKGVGITNMSSKVLGSILFPLPPLAEQKRIVAKIDELMTLCDKLEAQRKARDEKLPAVHTAAINRLLTAADKNDFDTSRQFITRHFDPLYSVKENVAELRKAILTLAMQGKLVKQDPGDRPAGELLKEIQAEKERLIKEGKIRKQKELPPIKPEEVPYEVPEGWEWTRLGEIGIVNPRNNITDDSLTAGFVPMPLISEGMANKHGFEEKLWAYIKKGYTHFTDGDIGMAKITPCFENAKSCVFTGLPNGIGAGTTELHIFRNTFNSVVPSFLLFFLKNPQFIAFAETKMTGSAGQKRVPTTLFIELLFPLPPLAEQKRIVAKIDELMALCDRLENRIDQAIAKRTALFDAVLAAM